MYAVHLPEHIPAPGSAGGPPLPSEFRQFAGAPFDLRGFFSTSPSIPRNFPKPCKRCSQIQFREQTPLAFSPSWPEIATVKTV